MRLATQALAALRERGVPHAGSEQGWLGMSLGLAMAEPGDTPLALYQRADRALYQAKHSGRNRVIAAA